MEVSIDEILVHREHYDEFKHVMITSQFIL